VRPVDDEYEVVVGERRYRALQQAGVQKVPAIVRDLRDDQVIELNLVENIQREDLSAVEKGNCCNQLMEKYPIEYPTLTSLAKRIGVDENTIRQWISTSRLPNEMQKLIIPLEPPRPVPKGRITYDTALHIAKTIDSPRRQLEVARELAERALPRPQARQVIREVARASERSVKEVVHEVAEKPYEMPFRLSHMEPILKGVKVQTSRRGIPDSAIKEGAIIHAAVWEPHFADLRVERIERKRLRDFTEEDAKREGGYTLEEFKEVWKNLHGQWNDDERVFVIHFSLESAR